jgi:hypothetical protein
MEQLEEKLCMSKQSCGPLTDTVVMVAPEQFGFNPETAQTNTFQSGPVGERDTPVRLREAACSEFQRMVEILRSHQIRVLLLRGREDVVTPDAVFPNNWFSHHREDILVLYPMLAPSRRAERLPDRLLALLRSLSCSPQVIDLSPREQEGLFLEGTGSLVLDRVHKVAFAMESPRTSRRVLDEWCRRMGYTACFFRGYDQLSRPVYHTNVFMNVGDGFAVACPQAIADCAERATFESTLRDLGKELVPISPAQLHAFCGNILHLRSRDGRRKIVLSQTALRAFTPKQLSQLERYGELVAIAVPTIERIGGGSVRCMLAEVFPPA